jgi:alpha-L-fucosidase 2
MKRTTLILPAALIVLNFCAQNVRAAASSADVFAAPARGFTSSAPARNWQQGLLTGNGTIGAIVMGQPHDETLYLSHASLFLPKDDVNTKPGMASKLEEVRKTALEGNFGKVGSMVNAIHSESIKVPRDPFIGALELHVKQPESQVSRYQRAVDFMTAETVVSVAEGQGSYQRRAFASRADDVLVLRVAGSGKQTAEFSFSGLPATSDKDKAMVADAVKSSGQGVKDGLLYFRTLFAHTNRYNPNIGYEAVGRVIAKGGTRTETATGISIVDANEILLIVKINPLHKSAKVETKFAALQQKLSALPPDYAKLLARHAKIHGDLMGRVSFSLDAPKEDRAKPSEQLNKDSQQMDAPLAKIERAFDAGRYNIICSTGFYPPNLQGLWSASWLAPWSGSFTTNGNLPTAVAFLLMGNTPELMQSYFRYYDERWEGFRENAQNFYGMRGFHVPPQLTLSPLETDFNSGYPHCFCHSGAPWALEFYYDYFRCTGDRKFLAQRAYPLMKEACAFFEDFLTVTDTNGKLVFVPSYSPENAPGGEKKIPSAINATMDIAAAKQLLGNTIAAAKLLGRDAELQKKWTALVAKMPAYEIAPDGSFREWLWPGLEESNRHRHVSQLYALYDGMPAEIVGNPALVTAVAHTISERMKFRNEVRCGMAFGAVHLGLSAEHIGNAEQATEIINMLAKNFWADGMASYHDWGNLFNMDISGGFPCLCANALVYADPGRIRFFPARPGQWKSGSIKGLRLRGGIVVRELTWDGARAKAVLVSDTDQSIIVELPDGKANPLHLRAGTAARVEL